MELSNALEEDLRTSMETCEKEATKPTAVTVLDQLNAQSEPAGSNTAPAAGVRVGSAGGNTNNGNSHNSNNNNSHNNNGLPAMRSPIAKSTAPSPLSGTYSAASPAPVHLSIPNVHASPLGLPNKNSIFTPVANTVTADNTAKNTALNAASKLPAEGSALTEVVNGQAVEGNSTVQKTARYDAKAVAYVQAFNAPQTSKTWRWCKESSAELNRAVGAMYGAVKGPVELIPCNLAEQMADISAKHVSRKPVIPSFRRKGVASHTPQTKRKAAVEAENGEFFVRDRVSIGSSGMPPSWLGNSAGSGTSTAGAVDNIVNGLGSVDDVSPEVFGTAEEERKRAMKFLLNDRETHYDLLHRDIVDAVTLLQMEQARAAAEARRRGDYADPLKEHNYFEQETYSADVAQHQYRQHHLLTSDYTDKAKSKQEDSNNTGHNSNNNNSSDTPSEEYSLYVSLPEMSAHSSLTARQVIRSMQTTSAQITLDTISKVKIEKNTEK